MKLSSKNKISIAIIIASYLLVSAGFRSRIFACGGSCPGSGGQCQDCCGVGPNNNGPCYNGACSENCNGDGCSYSVQCGGGGGCDSNNWGPCNVSCGYGTRYNDCGDPQSCYAGSCCTNSNPSAPTLISPANSFVTVNPQITLTWTAPASWGNNCGGNSQYYNVYFGTSANPTSAIVCSGQGGINVPAGTTTCTYTISAQPAPNTGTTYYWKVAASNNGLTTFSTIRSLIYKYPNVGTSIMGSAIWDATAIGTTCNQNDSYKASKELDIRNGDVTYSTTLPNSASVVVDGTKGTLPTYRINNTAYGTGTVCVNTSGNTIPGGLSFALGCVSSVADIDGNGTPDGAGSSSASAQDDKCALVVTKDIGVRVDLGFKLIPIHWITSVNGGDVFVGSTDMKVPADTDTTGGFKSYLLSGNGFVFGKGSIKVTDAVNNTSRVYENGGLAENIDGSFMPSGIFAAPSDAVTINSGCSNALTNLDPLKTYQISHSCLQDFINSGNNYSLSKDGVAIVYVSGSAANTITFGSGNKEFKSNGANRRVLLYTNTNVAVSSDLGLAAPTTSTAPQIEAGIVSGENVNFPGKGGALVDTSVVMEGPLVSKKIILSTRNRYLLNTYPTIAVKFNPMFVKFLKKQSDVLTNNVNGVSYDVVWDYSL